MDSHISFALHLFLHNEHFVSIGSCCRWTQTQMIDVWTQSDSATWGVSRLIPQCSLDGQQIGSEDLSA